MSARPIFAEAPAFALPPFPGPAQDLLEEGSADQRAYRIEVRPGFAEGQYLGLALRMWGDGHWVRRDGEPQHYTKREYARLTALRWLESGR